MQNVIKLPAVHLHLVRLLHYVVSDELEGLFLSDDVDPTGAVAEACRVGNLPSPDVYLGIGTEADLSFFRTAESPASPG